MVVKAACISLLVFGVGLALGQDYYSEVHESEVLVRWMYQGKEKKCLKSEIRIEQDGRFLPILPTEHGIYLDAELRELSTHRDQRITVHARCDDFSLDFPEVYASWLKDGWEFSIQYPPYPDDRGAGLPEHGTWISYLIWWDGWVQWAIHDDPFPGLRDAIASYRPDDSDSEDKYADAYSKAVLGIEYTKNRNLLLTAFGPCQRADLDFQNDCGGELPQYLANLYWRGDDGLLLPLFRAATDDLILPRIGYFYGQLLARKPLAAVQVLGQVSEEKQKIVCRRAADDELWSYPHDVLDPLRTTLLSSGVPGQSCWSAIESAEKEHGR